MPIREACHVAIQRTNPIKQKLWKHAQARQLANGAVPVVQIVCIINYPSLFISFYCTVMVHVGFFLPFISWVFHWITKNNLAS
jgi:hypothetical protein